MLAVLALTGGAVLAVSAPAAAKKVTTTSSRCVPTLSSAPIADFDSIGDGTTVNLPKKAKKGQPGRVTKVTVGVQISHTRDSDLLISLVNPAGTVIGLSIARGAQGHGFGNGTPGCGGSLVHFDDSATTLIATPGNIGGNPVLGTFRPDQPLASFSGGPAVGVWMVVVTDASNLAPGGQITAFDISVTYKYKKATKKK